MHERIFIGGLLDSIQDADLVKLFSSFGKVIDIDRMDYKERRYLKGTKLMRLRYERRIAYLTLDVKEDKAVQRAVRALHGTKWKGATLRCQLARPSGLDRIRKEIEEEERNQHAIGDDEEEEEEEGHMQEEDMREVVTKKPFAGAFVTSRMHSQDNKIYFDSDNDGENRIENVWAEIETPKQHVYNYEQHLEKCSQSIAEMRDEEEDRSDIDLRPKSKDFGVVEAFLKAQEKRRLVEFGKKTTGNTVDFFSQDDVKDDMRPRGIDLSRFDDSDDDKDFRIPQVDGADDTPSSSSADDDDHEGMGQIKLQKDSTSAEETSSSSSSSAADDDEQEEEQQHHDVDDDPDTMMAELQSLFPNGALFHRGETNMEQMQATWRVEGERMRKDFKHIKKQAKRSQRIPPSIHTNE